jgi:hypothetical protein
MHSVGCCNVTGMHQTFNSVVPRMDDAERTRRSKTPLTKKIAPEGGAGIV